MNESRSSRYHRHRRSADGLALCTRGLLLAGVVGSGASSWLAARATAVAVLLPVSAGGVPVATMAVLGCMLSVFGDVAVLPFSWYSRFVLERRYRGSRVNAWEWLSGYGRMVLLHAGLWMAGGMGLHVIIGRWPEAWWLVTGGVFGFLTLTLSHLGPVLVLPRLYDVRPLDRPTLCDRFRLLVRRSGAPTLTLHEWKLGLDAPPRAALVGLGATRRVLLSDALLADYSDDEIEVVVAHELAHHLNHDAWKTLAYEIVAAVVVFGAADLVLSRLGPSVGVDSIGAAAGLPLLALVAGVTALALAPVGNIMSRRHEQRADRDALKMTNRPDALVSGLRRLGEQNLAEERPSRLARWLFHTHPPLADRLAAAKGTAER